MVCQIWLTRDNYGNAWSKTLSFQILELALYRDNADPRVIEFHEGKVNIITGSSKTGKSSIIAIIDYCLGAGKCEVPSGPIQSCVSWYALRLQFPNKQMVIARKVPDVGADSHGDVYVDVGVEVTLPEVGSLIRTMHYTALVKLLTTDIGIQDNISIPKEGQTRETLTANIKHSRFYCFQPQDQIISRKHLFYQQSEQFIPQAIQDTLPFFLGAVGDERLIKLAQLRELRREAKTLQREIDEAELISGDSSRRADSLLAEAVNVGLIKQPASRVDYKSLLLLLRQALDSKLPTVPDSASSTNLELYDDLIGQRETITTRLRSAEEELNAVLELIRERARYSQEGTEHVVRLQSLDIYLDTENNEHICPICDTKHDTIPTAVQLNEELQRISERLTALGQDSPHLEKLAEQLTSRIVQFRDELQNIQAQVEGLQRAERELDEYRNYIGAIAHVRGRISIFIESAESNEIDSTAQNRLRTIQSQIEELERDLNDEDLQERLMSILSYISSDITKLARDLQLEHSEYPLRFSLNKLTVIADEPGESVPMSKMGAGANWVGYHIAVHLAFHTFFALQSRPVPRFIVFDQPSQVYFPADHDTDGQLTKGKEGRKTDEDREAVLRMFQVILEVIEQLQGKVQVIVTEHADPDVDWYQDAVIERWRDGKALVPTDWLN